MQRVGSPVPVSVRNTQAGPEASSSSDCSVAEVVHLASVASNVLRVEAVGSDKAIVIRAWSEKMSSSTSATRSCGKHVGKNIVNSCFTINVIIKYFLCIFHRIMYILIGQRYS